MKTNLAPDKSRFIQHQRIIRNKNALEKIFFTIYGVYEFLSPNICQQFSAHLLTILWNEMNNKFGFK